MIRNRFASQAGVLASALVALSAGCSSPTNSEDSSECTKNVECKSGQICVDGACVSSQSACPSACPRGTTCSRGSCRPVSCDGVGCRDGEVCVGEICVALGCEETSCGAGANCAADGECYPSDCAGKDCGANGVCENGECVDRLCVGRECPEGCVAGACVTAGDCSPACGAGKVCYDGACEEASCAGVRCREGETCSGGRCIDVPCQAGASRPCGDCGGGLELCQAGVWGVCSGEECAPGETGVCEAGGTKTCGFNCTWSDCGSPAECSEGEEMDCENCGKQTCGADGLWGECLSSCQPSTACNGFTCVLCGDQGEPCCDGVCSSGLTCSNEVCAAAQATQEVSVVSGSPEHIVMQNYPRLFGVRSVVLGSTPGFTIDRTRQYQGSDRYATFRQALLGEAVMAYSSPLRTDAGTVRLTAGSAEDKLMTAYPKLFGARSIVRDGTTGFLIAGRKYLGADRYATLKAAMQGEGAVF